MPLHKSIGLTTLLLDLCCVAAALVVGRHAEAVGSELVGRGLLYLVAWLVVTERLGTYLVPLHRSPAVVVRTAVEAFCATVAVAGLVDVTWFATPVAAVWRIALCGLLLLAIQRLLLVRSPLRIPAAARPRVLVLGAGDGAGRLAANRVATATFDLRGFISFPGETPRVADLPQLSEFSELEQGIVLHGIDLVLVCPSDRAVMGDVHRVFRSCDELGLSAQFFPPFLELDNLHASLTWIDGRLGLSLHSLQNRSLSLLCKRAIDFAGALVGLLLLLPAFLGCALAVRVTSRGPVFFAQQRVGKNGRLFRCLKFRTMRVGAQLQQEDLRQNSIQDGPAFKIPNDPRLTRIGGFLRRYSLDELPQLLNVLFGDMSLVGPRPPIPEEVARYTWWQRRRISVTPGLTCVWQVWGRNRVSFKRWVEMDLYYIDNWSLWLDLKLMLHTVRAVVGGTGM